MAYEVIELNLIPLGEVPVIHAAQYDKERPLKFALKLGEDDFNPSGYDLELQIRKVDNKIVTAASSEVTSNIVTFLTTEQMTACSGTNLGEIQITKDGLDIATLHFYLVVQRDVLAGGITSESEIHNLTEQIEEIVDEVMGDDYYTKAEVDEKIAEIPTFDPTNYYTKTEVDDKIAEIPTFDPTNYYTKTEVDYLISQVVTYTEVTGTLTAGSTSLTLSDASITATSTIDIYTDVFGVQPTNAVVTSGQIVLTFLAQNSDLSVKVRVS